MSSHGARTFDRDRIVRKSGPSCEGLVRHSPKISTWPTSCRLLPRKLPRLGHPCCVAFVRELERCIYCGAIDMSEEHLIADWVHRAFERKRHPGPMFGGTFVERQEMRMSSQPPAATAKVVCKRCNNEWLSRIDNAAAGLLKPLIRGDNSVSLDRCGQTLFASWIVKTALSFDAMENGDDGTRTPSQLVHGVS